MQIVTRCTVKLKDEAIIMSHFFQMIMQKGRGTVVDVTYYRKEQGKGQEGMELSSSFGDSNRPQVHVCILTYVGHVTWSHT